jgi:Tfp pilus assembly protein PilN
MVGDSLLQAELADLVADLVKMLVQVRARPELLVKVMLGGIHPVLVLGVVQAGAVLVR